MHQYRTIAEIPPDHRVVLDIPADIPAGKAEITVVVAGSTAPKRDIHLYLEELRTRPRETRSDEELNRQIQEQRDSWD